MKKGFTLAEVLVTLGIIGVVAAITMPGLVTNFQKKSIGPSLAKAVNTLVNANETMIADNDASRLSDIISRNVMQASPQPYVEKLREYIKGAPITKDNMDYFPDVETYSKTESGPLSVTAGIKTTNGEIFYFSTMQSVSSEAPKPYTGYAMELYIDINGVTEPNRIGIDLFRFFVDDNGMIIPYGGTVYNDYIGKGYDAEPLYMSEDDNACYVDDDGKEHVGNGGTCSGYIADNNWKVLY